jgi:CBS domain-containing protein
VLGVQTLLLGLVAASALRVTGALGRKRVDANAPRAEYTKSGARRAAVNITPRPTAAGGVLLEQLFAAKVNPDDPVSTVMTRGVLKARASDAVETVLTYFDKVTGIAVVSDDTPEAVVGVFSRRDAGNASKKDPISMWMTTPALTIDADTRIVECAALMLKHEVHRLPVVDDGGTLVGIITRTDVFNALLSKYKSEASEECVVPPPASNGRTTV